jgi:hypothetical protein
VRPIIYRSGGIKGVHRHQPDQDSDFEAQETDSRLAGRRGLDARNGYAHLPTDTLIIATDQPTEGLLPIILAFVHT